MKKLDIQQAGAYFLVTMVCVSLWFGAHRWGWPSEYTTPCLALALTILQGAMKSYLAQGAQ